jgi:DNA modification methylase
VKKEKYLHPTMKPVELVERVNRNSRAEGQRILDSFAGSGIDTGRLRKYPAAGQLELA